MFARHTVSKRQDTRMKLGCLTENNGAAGIAAGIAFNPDFVVHTSVTGTISSNDVSWKGLFPNAQHIVRLQPHTTGTFGRTLVQSSLNMLALTSYGDLYIADGRPVYPTGAAPIASYDYGLTNVTDVELVLNRTIQIAQSRNAKSITPPIDWHQIYIWITLLETGQTARAASFLENSGLEPDIISDLRGLTSFAQLPGKYQDYITLLRNLISLYRASNVDYINLLIPLIGTNGQISEIEFICNFWKDVFNKKLVSIYSAEGVYGPINGGRENDVELILNRYKAGGYKYIAGWFNTASQDGGVLYKWGLTTGALTTMGSSIKRYKESQT